MTGRRARPRFDVAPGGRTSIAADVRFERGCRVHVAPGGVLVIGAGTHFDEWCVIAVHERVEIGRDCRFGEGAAIFDFEADPAADPDRPLRLQPVRVAPVSVGDRCVIGTGAVLLPGASVPAGSVAEAKSVHP